MADAMITGAVWLFDIVGYVGAALILLLAWGVWHGVRTGQIAWTQGRERECLLFAAFCAAWAPPTAWTLVTAPSIEHAYFMVTNALTVWYFGRAWWKLHKDGPNNGRRRRRTKYALKRLGDRLVLAPIRTPVPR